NLQKITRRDGRCDSPGFSPKYCTYSVMNQADNRITDFELVQVTQTGTSQSMEKRGFCKTFDRLLKVKTVVTDRHVGIKSVIKKVYQQQGVNQQFDVYHISNSFRKKLIELSKQNIVNHVWFSSRNCDAEKKKWLKGATLLAVKEVVFDPSLLRDIRQISQFCHTGKLESYHSALLVYCPKRQKFDYPCMLARTQLAVMQYNANVGRQQATVKKMKAEGKQLPQVERPAGKNIAKAPAPPKEELIKKHVDRFKML
uniref:Uncharacterized protein n=1 Tax=Acanthochromis polyacanthus TaxID=80966 RepID=A0A3Q1EL66_9TELE